MDDYLSKPVGKHQLIAVLERWLNAPELNFHPEPTRPIFSAPAHVPPPIDLIKLKELYGEHNLSGCCNRFWMKRKSFSLPVRKTSKRRDDRALSTTLTP